MRDESVYYKCDECVTFVPCYLRVTQGGMNKPTTCPYGKPDKAKWVFFKDSEGRAKAWFDGGDE